MCRGRFGIPGFDVPMYAEIILPKSLSAWRDAFDDKRRVVAAASFEGSSRVDLFLGAIRTKDAAP